MAASDSQLRASEIKGVLLSEIENYSEELHAEEVGEVLEVKEMAGGGEFIKDAANALATRRCACTVWRCAPSTSAS